MPFDPNFPVSLTTASSAQMRDQLNSLKALIDAVPIVTGVAVDSVTTLPPGSAATVGLSLVGSVLHFAFGVPQGETGGIGGEGPIGPIGPVGPPFAGAVVDGVNTLNPGDPATVAVAFDGTDVRFTFGIPRGDTGTAGPMGPAFATALVDSVTTLPPGDAASVGVSFDGSNVRFAFGIPRGADGSQGNNGSDGAQGPPGEVTNAQLTTAIQGTSANSNAVTPLGLSVSDPPTQAELQAVANKLDELIVALRR